MATPRQQVEEYIKNDLPRSFVSGKISQMYDDLEDDIKRVTTESPTINQKQLEIMLHRRHKQLAFSYPSLFFKIVRGEVDPVMMRSLLNLKEKLDEDQLSLEEARNRVIDCAKSQIEDTKDRPRVKKAKPPGTVVQELSFSCKPEDS